MTKRIKKQTTLSVKLSASEYKAHYDASCKQLLSEKQILARIMKATLDEYKYISIPKIMACIEGRPTIGIEAVFPNSKTSVIRGENTEDTSIDEGTIRFDIKFRALAPGTDEFTEIIINVEAQNKFHQDYPIVTRAIYYVSRMLSSQYGTEFKNSEYGKIKKVASIWICTNPPKERRNTINRYWLNEEQMVGQAVEEKKNYDLLDVVLVCLGGPNQDNYNDLIKMLDVLLSKTISHENKRQILETEFEIEMTEELEEGLDAMCNLSQGVEDAAKKKAKKKQDLRHIKNVMESLDLSAAKAMEILKIPEKKRAKYEKLISS